MGLGEGGECREQCGESWGYACFRRGWNEGDGIEEEERSIGG